MKRYAIRLPDGTYARAGRDPCELEKAKLWRTRGHVTQHLDSVGAYPEGTVVVEVSIEASTAPLLDAAEWQRATEARRKREREERSVRYAAERVRAAERELDEARKAVGR